MRISKKRKEMGEEKWAEYQKERNRKKTAQYDKSDKGRINSIKVRLSRRRKKQKLIEYKGGVCELCGFNEKIVDCYDFHHTNPDNKEFGIADKEGKNWSLSRLKKEVDKCILVCSNCHRKIHYQENKKKIFEEAKEYSVYINDIW